MELPKLQPGLLKERADARMPDSRKRPISLTIKPTLLSELDQAAKGLGISRAAAVSLAVSRFVASERGTK